MVNVASESLSPMVQVSPSLVVEHDAISKAVSHGFSLPVGACDPGTCPRLGVENGTVAESPLKHVFLWFISLLHAWCLAMNLTPANFSSLRRTGAELSAMAPPAAFPVLHDMGGVCGGGGSGGGSCDSGPEVLTGALCAFFGGSQLSSAGHKTFAFLFERFAVWGLPTGVTSIGGRGICNFSFA